MKISCQFLFLAKKLCYKTAANFTQEVLLRNLDLHKKPYKKYKSNLILSIPVTVCVCT